MGATWQDYPIDSTIPVCHIPTGSLVRHPETGYTGYLTQAAETDDQWIQAAGEGGCNRWGISPDEELFLIAPPPDEEQPIVWGENEGISWRVYRDAAAFEYRIYVSGLSKEDIEQITGMPLDDEQ